MQVTRDSRRALLGQNLVFTLLFFAAVGLVAWLSTQYVYQADWTYGHRNSLSQSSVKLLGTLAGPVQVTAYARAESPFRDPLRRFFAKYQAVKPDLSLSFVDPDAQPQAARDAGIER